MFSVYLVKGADTCWKGGAREGQTIHGDAYGVLRPPIYPQDANRIGRALAGSAKVNFLLFRNIPEGPVLHSSPPGQSLSVL